MADRPAQICQLEKGKLIDGQQGFVDTFNWAVQSIANLEGGQNCEVQWTLPDHPTIDVTGSNEDGSGGGGYTAAVYDVTETQNEEGNRELQIEYTDGRANTYIPLNSSALSGVYDVVESVYEGERALEIQYTDDRANSYIVLGNGIQISADTDQATDVLSAFKLESQTDSNVKFTLNGNTIKIGVYYI